MKKNNFLFLNLIFIFIFIKCSFSFSNLNKNIKINKNFNIEINFNNNLINRQSKISNTIPILADAQNLNGVGPFNPLSNEYCLSKFNLVNIGYTTGTTSSVLYLGFPERKSNSGYFSTINGGKIPFTTNMGIIILDPAAKDKKEILAYFLTQKNNLGWEILTPAFYYDRLDINDKRSPLLISDYSDSLYIGHETGPLDDINRQAFGNTVVGSDSGVSPNIGFTNFGNTIFGKFNFSGCSIIFTINGIDPSTFIQSAANSLIFTDRKTSNYFPFYTAGWCNTILGTNNIVIKPIPSSELEQDFSSTQAKWKNYNVITGYGNLGNDTLQNINKQNYISQNCIYGNISCRNTDQFARNISIGNQNFSSYYYSSSTSFQNFYENIVIGNSIFWGIHGSDSDFYWQDINRNIFIIPDTRYYIDDENLLIPITDYTKNNSIANGTNKSIFLGTCGAMGDKKNRSNQTYIDNIYNTEIETSIFNSCAHSVWISNENLLGWPIPITLSEDTNLNLTETELNDLSNKILDLPVFGIKITNDSNGFLFGIDSNAISNDKNNQNYDPFRFYITRRNKKSSEIGPFEYLYLIPLIILSLKNLNNKVNFKEYKNEILELKNENIKLKNEILKIKEILKNNFNVKF